MRPKWDPKRALCALLVANSMGAFTQTLISTAGSTAPVTGGSISWSMGETVTRTGTVPGGIITQGFQQPSIVRVRLNVAAFLQGPYDIVSGTMKDDLRAAGLLPLTEPYTALGYSFTGGGGESTTQPIIDFPGSNAIIDWVVLELRDKNDNTSVLHSRSALLQTDGDVVEVDGFSAVLFPVPADDYFLAVRHRNHLAVMTQNSLALSGIAAIIDLTDGSTETHGTEAQREVAGTRMLWAGDVNFDGTVKYTGANNDRDPILQDIGGSVATSTVTGYLSSDVNMDGTAKYTGQNNDRDIILQNIGGVVPTNTRTEQVP
jgi:hypothetical protein